MTQIIDRIKNLVLKKYVNNEVLFMVLVGSSVNMNEIDNINDVDILIIQEDSASEFSKLDQQYDNIKIDLVTVGDQYLWKLYEKKVENIFDLNMLSAFFIAIRDGAVWYQKYPDKGGIVKIANEWTWNPDYYNLFDFQSREPSNQLFKNAFSDHLKMLNVLKSRMKNNESISYRRKDLHELHSNSPPNKVLKARDIILPIYEQLKEVEEWEFVPYVHKAIEKNQWGKALDNLKDILHSLVYHLCVERSTSYFDPSIWAVIEEKGVSEELHAAISSIYH
ncbi:MAG: hypothetical protein ACW98K_15425 [Candidatus Kariarchaeaceae archaeon]|jgi:hypothetical protein